METQKKPDLIVRGGRVFDPARGIDGQMDIAISAGKITAIAPILDGTVAGRVVNVEGSLVTAGLIDMHTHVAGPIRKIGEDDLYLEPDTAGVRSGVTTVVDAGSVGAYNLGGFARFVVPQATSRVVSFLHAGTLGIFHAPEIRAREDIDVDSAIEAIIGSDGLVRGVKVRMVGPAIGLLGIELPRLAKEIARGGGVPLMVHVGDYITSDPIARELAPVLLNEILTAGDIVTHTTSHQIGALLDADGTLFPEVRSARDRGVLFDTGVGMRNFTFKSARTVLDQDFLPDTISSDLTVEGRDSPTHSLTECMNKYMALGMSLEHVIVRTTSGPASALDMSDKLGAIALGREADLTVMDRTEGDWVYRDRFGGSLRAQHKALTPRLVIRSGELLVPDFGPRPWGWLPETAA